jgi:DNA invertase Pin-like site-specific DNA recombinase
VTAAARRRRRRQEEVVRLRAKGYSLRSIARTLDCGVETVRRALQASHLSVPNETKSVPDETPKRDTPDNVVRLRRKAG